MAGNPVRFVLSRWPWRSLAYVVSSVAVISIVWLAVLPLLLFPPLLLLVGMPIGAWVRLRLTEAATWRELGYCACLLSVLALLDLAAVSVLFICLLLVALPLL